MVCLDVNMTHQQWLDSSCLDNYSTAFLEYFIGIFPWTTGNEIPSTTQPIVKMEEIEISTIVGNQGETKVEEKKVEHKLHPVSTTILFLRFTSGRELLCLVCGFFCVVCSIRWCIGAIISGMLTPISYIYSGQLLDELNRTALNYDDVEWTLFWYSFFLFLSSLFLFFEKYLLHYFAGCDSTRRWCIEHITRHYRDAYMRALLERDVEFIEQFGPGMLGQRFSEQSSAIVDGLGPTLGGLCHAISGLATGIVIGFISVATSHWIHS